MNHIKIGYFIPRKHNIFNKSGLIEWGSNEGINFIKSLVENGNISLPTSNEYSEISFNSKEDFYLALELLAVYKYYKGSIPNDGGFYQFYQFVNNKNNKISIEDSFKKTLNDFKSFLKIQSHVCSKFESDILGKLIALCNIKDRSNCDLYFGYGFRNILFNEWERDIEIKGFKLIDEKYDLYELYSAIGYSQDALKNNLKDLELFNEKYRNNYNERVNSFYKVIRTNDMNDKLFISPRRCHNEKVILVLKTHKLNVEIDTDVTDKVYFVKTISVKDEVAKILVSDGYLTGNWKEDEKNNYMKITRQERPPREH